MPPVQFDIHDLTYKWLSIREIPLCLDVAGLIADIFVKMMRAIHVDEILTAQMILTRERDIFIMVNKARAYKKFEFYPTLRRASKHKKSCEDKKLRLLIGWRRTQKFDVQVIACECQDYDVYGERCKVTAHYNDVKEILRVAYDNSFDLCIESDDLSIVAVFEYWY